MMKYYFPSLFILLCCVFCNTKDNIGDSPLSQTVAFEKLDSIRIDYLGNLKVHDLDPFSETVLLEDGGPYSQEIILANFDGTLINSFSKFGDMPDSYGGLMGSMRLLTDSSFLVYGYNGFMTYHFDGNLLSRVKLVDFQPPNYVPARMGHGMERSGERYLYVDQSFPPNKDYSDARIYEEKHLLNWLYPETGETEPFIKFPENSIFRSGKYFFRNSWNPVFTLDDNNIYVAFGIEPVIYAYEAHPPYSIIFSFPLDLHNYQYFKGEDSYGPGFELRGFKYGSGSILNIRKIGGYFVVAYFKGYEKGDREESLTDKSPEKSKLFRERMQKKYPTRIAILDSLGNLVNDFVPGRLYPQSMLIRNGELWMMEMPDEEVEQDYFRLFRVGLKVDD